MNIYQIDNRLKETKKIFIFGTGWHAMQTYVELSAQGIQIEGFADRFCEDSGKKILNLPIISEDELIRLNPVVVIASTSWKEICKRLESKGVKYIYVDEKRYGDVEIKDGYLRSLGNVIFDKDTLYILCPAGIGDTLYSAAYATEIKRAKGFEKICYITKGTHECIAKMFCGVDKVISSDDLVRNLSLFSINTRTWYLSNYLYGHYKVNRCHTFLSEWQDDDDKFMLSFYKRRILKIPLISTMDKFNLPKSSNVFSNTDIVLMPYANTIECLPKEIWKTISCKLFKMGFNVFTNVASEKENPVEGTKALMLAIDKVASECENCRAVIALRSGMCDVLAMTRTKLIVINSDDELEKNWDLKKGIRDEGITNIKYTSNYDINKIVETILTEV